MNPSDRKSNPHGPAGNKKPAPSFKRRQPPPEPEPAHEEDWVDSNEDEDEDAGPATSSKTETGGEKDDVEDAQEADVDGEDRREDGDDPDTVRGRPYQRREGVDEPEAKGFFASLGDGLRSAGETAKRYTRIGLARAELEKLRFELRSALAKLGELALHCWRDAPDVGLTAKDPAVYDAVKHVKQIRFKIREKQARIAHLKKDHVL